MTEVFVATAVVTTIAATGLAWLWRADLRGFALYAMPWVLVAAIGALISGYAGFLVGGPWTGVFGVALFGALAMRRPVARVLDDAKLDDMVKRLPEDADALVAYALVQRKREGIHGFRALVAAKHLLSHGLDRRAHEILSSPTSPKADPALLAADALWRAVIVHLEDREAARRCLESARAILDGAPRSRSKLVLTESLDLAFLWLDVSAGKPIDVPDAAQPENEASRVGLVAHMAALRGDREEAARALAQYAKKEGPHGLRRVAKRGGPAAEIAREMADA